MPPFEGTDNKSVIREQWDLPLVAKWSKDIDRQLSYFGLPGPKILDVRAWRQYLHTCTGVELLRNSGDARKEDLNVHRQLQVNVSKYDIPGFQLLLGAVEDIILDGHDLYNIKPRLANNQHPLICKFQYDLINLDFLGGLGYRNKHGESKRVRAIKKLIERQQQTNFLFILTLNVRDQIENEFDRYLLGSESILRELKDTLEWYRVECKEGMKEYKLKSVVPLFIRREAEQWGFDCYCHPPIVYEGNGRAKMVHFVFEMHHTPVVLHAFSKQSEADVLNLAFLRVIDSNFKLLDVQHPGFNYDLAESQLKFLPYDLCKDIVQQKPSLSHMNS